MDKSTFPLEATEENEASPAGVDRSSSVLSESTRSLLFLCTWNYYRSRFAEIYFNWLIEKKLSTGQWRATSRGLALPESMPRNLSIYTVEFLTDLGIPFDEARKPADATGSDFLSASKIIALKEDEHRPLMESRFPAFSQRVEYWNVHDRDVSEPAEQLPVLKKKVEELVGSLLDAVAAVGEPSPAATKSDPSETGG